MNRVHSIVLWTASIFVVVLLGITYSGAIPMEMMINMSNSFLNASGCCPTRSRESIKSSPQQMLANHILARRSFLPKYQLSVCTMVKNEVPYIVEWIEFMRIQGVQQFIIYDDGSGDNITFLNQFYGQNDPDCMVHIFNAFGPKETTITSGLKRQTESFQHCVDTFGANSDWMMILDADEFFYSPVFGTIAALLGNISGIENEQNQSVNHISAITMNFGSSGQQHRFGYKLVQSTSGDGRILYQNGCGMQLLTDHVHRGPHQHLETEMYMNLTQNKEMWICKLPGYFSPCRHNPGKSLFRPQDVLEAGVHAPAKWREKSPSRTLWFTETPTGRQALLLGNHYYYRSRDDVALKAAQWHIKEHIRNFNLTDTLLWGALRDDRLQRRWGAELASRMRRLATFDGPCEEDQRTLLQPDGT